MGQVFEISNFKDGLDNSVEPWLTIDDAIIEVDNYQTFRGVLQTRLGINQYAQGGLNSKPTEESRIYTTTTGETVVDGQATFIHTLATPVRPGSVTFSESGGDSATDDGSGGFTGDFDGGATIDYFTGVVSATWTNGAPTTPVVTYTHSNSATKITNEDIADTQTASGTLSNIPVKANSVVFTDGSTQYAYDDGAGGLTGDVSAGSVTYSTGAYSITWNASPGGDSKVSYVYENCKPVMMIANFISETNVNELIVASTNQFNKYVSGNNRFEPITLAGSASAPTGEKDEYFSWTNYLNSSNQPRLLM